MTTSRYRCINCSEDEVGQSIDLCANCFQANKHATRRQKVHHPAHNMIQFRAVKWRVYMNPTIDTAKQMLTWAENELNQSAVLSTVQTTTDNSIGLHCVVCRTSITAPPYWCCLTCTGAQA